MSLLLSGQCWRLSQLWYPERLAPNWHRRDAAEKQALDAVERIGNALKNAFTAAIRHVYQVSILIALLALLITLMLPELPLRKTNAMGPPPPAMD